MAEFRPILGDRDLVLMEGEAVEVDTRVPRWFGYAAGHPAELLSLLAAGVREPISTLGLCRTAAD